MNKSLIYETNFFEIYSIYMKTLNIALIVLLIVVIVYFLYNSKKCDGFRPTSGTSTRSSQGSRNTPPTHGKCGMGFRWVNGKGCVPTQPTGQR
jgi:hypothetical protein